MQFIKSLSQIQVENRAWAARNFGSAASWQPMLGVVEEIGELAHAYLKASQGIRTNEDHLAKEKDAVGDLVIYLMHFCSLRGYDLHEVVAETWEQVSKRDWKNNSATGAQTE